jgi:hypothetical protein
LSFNTNNSSSSSSNEKKHLTSSSSKEEETNPIINRDLLTLEPREKEILNETAQELNIDLEHNTDLNIIPPESQDLSEDELSKLVEDKDTKTLERDIGDNPTIMDTLRNPEDLGKLSIQDIKNIGEEKAARRYELIMNLANADTLKLHLNMGIRNNKEIWVEKEFWFKSFDQKERFRLSTLEARYNSLRIKQGVLLNKTYNQLTEEDNQFMISAPFAINVSYYRLQEYEYRLKFGMAYDEYTRVSSSELDLAREIYDEHIKSIPSYSRRRFNYSSRDGRGTTLGHLSS